MPQGDRIEDRAGSKGGDEAVDPRHFDQKAIQRTGDDAEHQHDADGDRPGQAIHGLQADREDVPEHDAIADREVDAARDHGDHRGKRQERDDRLVRQDGPDIEHGRKCIGQQDRKQQDQPEHQDDKSIGRGETDDLLCSGHAAKFVLGGFDGIGLYSGHGGPQAASPADAAWIRDSVESSTPLSSATGRPRLKTMARWQILAVSSKSVDTTRTPIPLASAL